MRFAGKVAVVTGGASGIGLAAARRFHSDGGAVVMPLERQMWGDDYGLLADKFGILWHINIAGAAA